MRVVAIWICCCAYLNCVGWTLSALHQLNTVGYTLAVAVGLVALWRSQHHCCAGRWPAGRRMFARRFRRPLPLIFLFVTCLIFLGGFCYAPNNYDGLTYRLPRLL